MNVGIVCRNRTWKDPTEPQRHLAAGLRRLGHTVQVAVPAAGVGRLFGRMPEVAFLWNGAAREWAAAGESLRAAGVRTVIMERGFFDRLRYTQLDRSGFNHTASWAGGLAQPAPAGGLERFLAVWGRPPAPFGPRGGHVLVLLQVPDDAQLRDSEVRRPGALVRAVEAAAPPGIEIRVRPNPLSGWACKRDARAPMLPAAVAGAKFCITINSNAGNEALAMGCPVLCLGPALYARAGVARRTSLAGLAEAMREMLAGWRPEEAAVTNYLAHLACRQWSCDELAAGGPLERLLDETP